MALRARLSPPREERNDWPWHHVKSTAVSASLLTNGDRRMEAETYLASGYGIRLAIEGAKAAHKTMSKLAKVWQPYRLKGIQVSPEFGTPFLAATQVFDLRPIPRKWLALDQTHNYAELLVSNGMILVTRSGSVGRATLAHKPHENVLISDDLLRVEPRQIDCKGWLYAFLRSRQARAMMSAAQYGHIIKHLEVSHLNALPVPIVRNGLLAEFNEKFQHILDNRNRAYSLLVKAEQRFEKHIGPLKASNFGESGFSVSTSALFSTRRRLEGSFHNPLVDTIRNHFIQQGKTTTRLINAGFDIWLPTRFKRVPASEGVEFLDSSDLFEINPDITKRIADGNFGDRNNGRVKAGWLMLARSGQVYGLNGSLTIATEAHEGKVISDHVIRIAPTERQSIRTGYIYVALSHPTLGRPLIKSLAYGSSIPEIEPADVEKVEVVRIGTRAEETIADLAEEGSSLLAKADIMENEIAARAEKVIDRLLIDN
jgi:hypothetical protein